jgi:hypothetical protein
LPPPQPLDVEVVSLNGPVAGAKLFWNDRTDHRLWATTNADGVARLTVPRVWGNKGEGALRYRRPFEVQSHIPSMHVLPLRPRALATLCTALLIILGRYEPELFVSVVRSKGFGPNRGR